MKEVRTFYVPLSGGQNVGGRRFLSGALSLTLSCTESHDEHERGKGVGNGKYAIGSLGNRESRPVRNWSERYK